MSDIAIRRPIIVAQRGNSNLQTLLGGELGYKEDSAAVLYNNGFVTLDAQGDLVPSVVVSTAPVATGAGTTFLGFVKVSESGQTGLNPPYSMWGDGTTYQPRYFPEDLRGLQFAMNITDASFNIGEANGAPPLSEAILGASFALIVGGTTTPAPAGRYSGVYAVNVDDTTNPDVKIVDVPRRWMGVDQSTQTTAFNGIVIVEFIAGRLLNANG